MKRIHSVPMYNPVREPYARQGRGNALSLSLFLSLPHTVTTVCGFRHTIHTDDRQFADTLSLFRRLLSKQSYVFITRPLSAISLFCLAVVAFCLFRKNDYTIRRKQASKQVVERERIRMAF